MLDGLNLVWFLLPLGGALGWALARSFGRQNTHRSSISGDYLSGLSHLVNEDPDQAVAALMHAVEIQPETIELHMTLGTLFRRRGEVDRALRLHENLLKRGNLDPAFAQRVRYELAQDYLKAGLIDHAERLFKEQVQQGLHLEDSLEALRGIHEQLRDWRHAIEAAQQLEAVLGKSLKPLIAHYHCERAQLALDKKDYAGALKYSGRALSAHADCVRASLLQGAVHEAQNDFAAAAKDYLRVPEQDPRFLREVLPLLKRCHEQLQDLAGYREYLEEAEERWPDPAPVLERTELMRAEGVDPLDYLAGVLKRRPTWAVSLQLLDALEGKVLANPQIPVKIVREAMGKLNLTSAYQCHNCGLRPGKLFWQCPSCSAWGSITPAADPLLAAAGKPA